MLCVSDSLERKILERFTIEFNSEMFYNCVLQNNLLNMKISTPGRSELQFLGGVFEPHSNRGCITTDVVDFLPPEDD